MDNQRMITIFYFTTLKISNNIKNVHFIKMDIEGSEKAVFEKIDTDTLSKISVFAIEIHEHLVPGTFELITRKLSMYEQVYTGCEFNCFIKN